MVWFEAGVLGAIRKAKAESRLFVMLVVDGTEQSAVLESRLLHDEVAEFISQNAVALRLEAASPDSQAFFQIYPASEIPALYFINPANGTLLAAEGEADAAPSQILASLELHLASVRAWSQPEPPPGPSSTNEAESTAQSQGAPAGGDRAGQVARLRELAKESLQRKEREREQDQREQERRKREEAKELAKLREDRERAQALQAAEQLKRSRREEEEARRKIKEQIASDRAERASRQVPHGPQQARHQEAAPEAAERQQGIVNLQVKLTDGTSLRSTFEADAPLSSVRRFIEERRTDGRDPYIMLMTHPYRHFTELDMASTLSDLGLFPNGTIILKPTPVVSHAFSGASVSRVPPSARAPLSVGLVLQDMLRSFLDTIRGLIASLRGSANPAGLEEEARAGTEPPRAERARPAPEPGRIRGLRDLTGGGGRTSDRQEQQFYNGNSLSFDG